MYFQNNLVEEAFNDYLEMRKEKWKKYIASNVSIKRAVNLLNKYDDKTKIIILETSIINNRTWLFPPKFALKKDSDSYKHKNWTDKKQFIQEDIKEISEEDKQKSKDILQKARNLFRNI